MKARNKLSVTLSLLAALPAGGVYAQDADSGRSKFVFEEIVVVAQRKSENLQDVPVAVSAVTQNQLEAKGITGIANFQIAVPSLSVQNVAGYLGTHLRGIGSIANGPGFENPIALYVDGVYYANQSFGLAGFNNIERIEVLKGPQGTLFGRNATGGLIHMISKDPGQSLETRGSLDLGNYNRTEAKFYIGGPVSDTISADLAVRYANRDEGWGKNQFNGKEIYETYDDAGFRSKWVWEPESFKITAAADYGYRHDSMNALRTTPGTFIVEPVPAPVYPGDWDIDSNADQFVKTKGGGLSLKFETDLDFATVSNLLAWRDTNFRSLFDYDGSPLPLIEVLIKQEDTQLSNEFQLTSNSSGALSWVAGIYLFEARGTAKPIAVTLADDPALNPNFPLRTVLIYGDQDTESASGYAQLTYDLTDALSFTGGIRYSWEKRKLDAFNDGQLALPGDPIVNLIPTVKQDRTFTRPSYRAALDYHLSDDVMVYASINTGFKSGGFNVTIPIEPSYDPEKLVSYEIGEKADLFDHRVRLNTALFYYDYRDLQVQIPQPVGTGFSNGEKTEIYGADIDLTVLPMEGLEITASATLLGSEFKKFDNAPLSAENAGRPVLVGSVAGNEVPYTPSVVSSITANYTIPMGNNELVFNAGWLHSEDFYFEPDNVAKEDAYDQFNASITYNIDNGRYYVSAYGTNLSDELVRSLVQSTPTGPRLDALQSPRVYGLRVGFDF